MPAVLDRPHALGVELAGEPQRLERAVVAGGDRQLPARRAGRSHRAPRACASACVCPPRSRSSAPSLRWLSPTERISGGHTSVGAMPRSLSVLDGYRKPVNRRRRGVGVMGDVGRVRAGAQPYLGARPGMAPGRRHDGWWGDPAWVCGAAARSIRAVHEPVVAAGAGVELAAVHLGDGERDAHRPWVRSGRSLRRRVLAAGDSCASGSCVRPTAALG